MLFNIALEKAVRASGIEKRGTIYHKSVQILAYADDIDIIGRTERAVREDFENLERTA
jgi:sorting nexin-29